MCYSSGVTIITDSINLAEQLARFTDAEQSVGLMVLNLGQLDVHGIVAVRETARLCDAVVVALHPSANMTETEQELLVEAGADVLLQLPETPTPLAVAWPQERQDLTSLMQTVVAIMPLVWVVPVAHQLLFRQARAFAQTFPYLTSVWAYTTPQNVLPDEIAPLRQALLAAQNVRERGERQANALSRTIVGLLDDETAQVTIRDVQTGLELETLPPEAIWLHVQNRHAEDALLI